VANGPDPGLGMLGQSASGLVLGDLDQRLDPQPGAHVPEAWRNHQRARRRNGLAKPLHGMVVVGPAVLSKQKRLDRDRCVCHIIMMPQTRRLILSYSERFTSEIPQGEIAMADRSGSRSGPPEGWNAEGAWAQQAEAELPTRRLEEEIELGLALGLDAAPSITDRTISTFVRGELPHFAGEMGTFLKCPFLDDVRLVKDAEVAIFGAPLDAGTTYRPGTRFGPQGIRRATNLFGTYSVEQASRRVSGAGLLPTRLLTARPLSARLLAGRPGCALAHRHRVGRHVVDQSEAGVANERLRDETELEPADAGHGQFDRYQNASGADRRRLLLGLRPVCAEARELRLHLCQHLGQPGLAPEPLDLVAHGPDEGRQ
jgi:hypothetical protein